MTNPYDQHIQAVGFAGMAVAELQGQILATKESAEQVLNTIAAAVGDAPRNTDAIEAMAMMNDLIRLIGENGGMCEGIVSRLNAYSGAF